METKQISKRRKEKLASLIRQKEELQSIFDVMVFIDSVKERLYQIKDSGEIEYIF